MKYSYHRTNPLLKIILALSAVLLVLCLVAGCLAGWFTRAPEPGTARHTIWRYAKEHGYSLRDYPDSLIDLLERNPETEQFVLEYPSAKNNLSAPDMTPYLNTETVPLFMQWDPRWGYLTYGSDVAGLTGCGPVCLSMAAIYVTDDPAFSPDAMIRFAAEEGYYVPGSGSSWTLISQGGVKLGLSVTELPLDEGQILKSLEAGHPVICAMGPGDFTATGHFIVITGARDGYFTVNDPNSKANSEYLWQYAVIKDQIRNLWSVAPGNTP